jgi:hypothetical protein
MLRAPFFALLLLITPVLFLSSSHSLLLEGLVQTEEGLPIFAASVRFQGEPACTRTDHFGRFQLRPRPGRITATRSGYRIGWARSDLMPLRISLAPIPTGDNDDYTWIDPAADAHNPNNCANCHKAIHHEWARSAHARSASNPKLLALLNGTDGKRAPRSEWNLQAEHPAGVGVCVKCHAPTFQDPTLEYDFRSIKGVAAGGVHCDYCHKIAAAPTDKLGIRFGRDGYPLLRPKDGALLTFGPLDDAVRPGESFVHAPFYKESPYCASCHEGILFGVHVYGTYSEWLASPARRAGQQCQSCHMAPTGAMTNVAPGKGGIERDPKTLANHEMAGAIPEMLRKCLQFQVEVNPEKDHVKVVMLLRADNVGHRVPTGFIDRHLVLVVRGLDARGKPVAATAGPKLDLAAGLDLAGQAGWLYAKRLHGPERSPVPFWVPSDSMTDTRLHPNQPDTRTFIFPATAKAFHARVIYRRFWPEIAERFQWSDNEILICSWTTR